MSLRDKLQSARTGASLISLHTEQPSLYHTSCMSRDPPTANNLDNLNTPAVVLTTHNTHDLLTTSVITQDKITIPCDPYNIDDYLLNTSFPVSSSTTQSSSLTNKIKSSQTTKKPIQTRKSKFCDAEESPDGTSHENDSWYQLNHSTFSRLTTAPHSIPPTNPSTLFATQTVHSINPYREIKNKFGDSKILLPHHDPRLRLRQELSHMRHISGDDRRRLESLYNKQGKDSIFAPGTQLLPTSINLHYCSAYTNIANNNQLNLQSSHAARQHYHFYPNDVLYYVFISNENYYRDLMQFEQLQNMHDFHGSMDFCFKHPGVPQCLYHLSYICEYHNQLADAFNYIRMAVALFEQIFSVSNQIHNATNHKDGLTPFFSTNDVIQGILYGKVRLLVNIPEMERETILYMVHGPNAENTSDLSVVQHCNQQLVHCMTKVFARYAHFLSKKAASSSAYGVAVLGHQLTNFTYAHETGQGHQILSYYNCHIQNGDKSPQIISDVCKEDEAPDASKLLQFVNINTLHQHLQTSYKEMHTNLYYDTASLCYFMDYYALKGNRNIDLFFYALNNTPTHINIPNNVVQTIDALQLASDHNIIQKMLTNTVNTTSTAELQYVYTCGILAPLLSTYHDGDSKVVNNNFIISVSSFTTQQIFPLTVAPFRWYLNWSYSMAFALIKLEYQFNKKYEHAVFASDSEDQMSPFHPKNQYNIVKQMDLVTLLSLDLIDMNTEKKSRPCLNPKYAGMGLNILPIDTKLYEEQQNIVEQSMLWKLFHFSLKTKQDAGSSRVITILDQSIVLNSVSRSTNSTNINTIPNNKKGKPGYPHTFSLFALAPHSFTSLAYLARAVILFPETILDLCGSGDNFSDISHEMEYLISLHGSASKNAYFDKHSSVYAKRTAGLWQQSNIAPYVKYAIKAAFSVVQAFEAKTATPLRITLPQVRTCVYNPYYYKYFSYSLAKLENSDYCDDVTRIDTEDIFANEPRQAQPSFFESMSDTIGGMSLSRIRSMFPAGMQNMPDLASFSQSLGSLFGGMSNMALPVGLQGVQDLLSFNNDNGEDDDEGGDDDLFDETSDEEDYAPLVEMEANLRALGMSELEIQQILIEEQSAIEHGIEEIDSD